MKKINIIKYNNNKKIIENKNISNVDVMFNENKEVIDRLCDMLSLFLGSNESENLKSIIDELQEYDYIKIEMYKE